MKHTALTLGLAVLAGGALQAQVYQYGVGDPDRDGVLDPGSINYNPRVGFIDRLDTQFDAGNRTFDFSVDFSANSGLLANSFWLLVSDGDDPKGNVDELAIFYFDGTQVAAGGDAVVTTYIYNGANSSLSFQDSNGQILSSLVAGDPISASGSVIGDTASYSFSIDASGVNDGSALRTGRGTSGDWKGAGFGDEFGIWFHPAIVSSVSYGAAGTADEGDLTEFTIQKAGWFDGANFATVPEPSASLLAAVGSMGLLLRRRRK